MIFKFGLIIGIFFDLISKLIAKSYFQNEINIVGDFFYIKYTENIGIAFSIALTGMLLKIITVIIIIGIYIYYLKYEKIKKNKLIDLSFGLILAGALANAYSRIFDGFVIDFIGIKYFAVFNLADSFITIGMILYLLVEMKFFSSKK